MNLSEETSKLSKLSDKLQSEYDELKHILYLNDIAYEEDEPIDSLIEKVRDISPMSIDFGMPEQDEDGTYLVTSYYELVGLANYINTLTDPQITEVNAKLMNDINVGYDTTVTFPSIGTDKFPYTGKFDGQGHSISYIDSLGWSRAKVSGQSYIGLFGYAKNATITGITIKYSAMNTVTHANNYYGLLVGYAEKCTISNCKAYQCYMMTSCNSNGVGGMLIGAIKQCNVSGCSVFGDNTQSSVMHYKSTTDGPMMNIFGGLIGQILPSKTYSTISQSYVNMYLVGNGNPSITYSEFIGKASSATITNCYVISKYSKVPYPAGTPENYMPAYGTFIASMDSGSISNCYCSDSTGLAGAIPSKGKSVTVDESSLDIKYVDLSALADDDFNLLLVSDDKLYEDILGVNEGYPIAKWESLSLNPTDYAIVFNTPASKYNTSLGGYVISINPYWGGDQINLHVDWGDGSSEIIDTSNIKTDPDTKLSQGNHLYKTPGTHVIKIKFDDDIVPEDINGSLFSSQFPGYNTSSNYSGSIIANSDDYSIYLQVPEGCKRIGQLPRYNDDGTLQGGTSLYFNFYGLGVRKIKLPSTLEVIGDSCFSNNKELTSIKIPSSVKYIGQYAFSYCFNLRRIKLESGKDKLGLATGSFQNCPVVNYVDMIGRSLVPVRTWGPHLTDWVEATDPTSSSSFYGGWMSADSNPLSSYGGADVVKHYYGSTNLDNMRQVELAIKTNAVPYQGFMYHRSLKSVDITPIDSSLVIGYGAFQQSSSYWVGGNYSNESLLDAIHIHGNDLFISDYSFSSHPAKVIEIGDESATKPTTYSRSYSGSICDYAMYPSSSDKIPSQILKGCELIIHEGIRYVGYMAFAYMTVKRIHLPESLEYILPYAFEYADIHTDELYLNCRVGYGAFMNSTYPSTPTYRTKGPKKLILGPRCTFESNSSYQNIRCDNYSSTTPYQYKSPEYDYTSMSSTFYSYVFEYNDRIEELESSCKLIPPYAFYGCVNLTKVVLKDGSQVLTDYAFYGSGITTIEIPSTLTKMIGFNACYSSYSNDPVSPFSGCSLLKTINVSEDNEVFSSVDGVLYNKDKTILYWIPDNYQDDLVIPESVICISITCLKNLSTHFRKVTLPRSLNSVLFPRCNLILNYDESSSTKTTISSGPATEDYYTAPTDLSSLLKTISVTSSSNDSSGYSISSSNLLDLSGLSADELSYDNTKKYSSLSCIHSSYSSNIEIPYESGLFKLLLLNESYKNIDMNYIQVSSSSKLKLNDYSSSDTYLSVIDPYKFSSTEWNDSITGNSISTKSLSESQYLEPSTPTSVNDLYSKYLLANPELSDDLLNNPFSYQYSTDDSSSSEVTLNTKLYELIKNSYSIGRNYQSELPYYPSVLLDSSDYKSIISDDQSTGSYYASFSIPNLSSVQSSSDIEYLINCNDQQYSSVYIKDGSLYVGNTKITKSSGYTSPVINISVSYDSTSSSYTYLVRGIGINTSVDSTISIPNEVASISSSITLGNPKYQMRLYSFFRLKESSSNSTTNHISTLYSMYSTNKIGGISEIS